MVKRNEEQTLNVGLRLLNVVGIKPQTNNNVKFYIATLTRCLILYLAFEHCKRSENLDQLTDGFEAIGSWIQGSAKTLTFLLYEKRVMDLINETKHFPPTENNPRTAKIFERGIRLLNMFYYLAFATWVMYCLAPCVTRKPIFATWIPDVPHGNLIVIIVQFFLLFFDVFTVIGTDLIFCGLSINIYAQFIILQDKLEALRCTNYEQLKSDIKKCVIHHEYLLEYLKKLSAAFESCLLLMYANGTFALCFQLYAISEATSVFIAIRRSCYLLVILSQLGFYFIPADLLADIAQQMSYAVYNCKWYQFDNKNAKTLSLLIVRAQRPVVFSACGLITVNKTAFTKIFKSSLSFLALLRQMKETS